MDTKSVMYGMIGLIIGGILVGAGAAVLNGAKERENSSHSSNVSLESMTGDEYDEAFLNIIIEHHEMAVEMAKQSATNAKHDELKQFSNELIMQGEAEIKTMKQWQVDWGYASRPASHTHY